MIKSSKFNWRTFQANNDFEYDLDIWRTGTDNNNKPIAISSLPFVAQSEIVSRTDESKTKEELLLSKMSRRVGIVRHPIRRLHHFWLTYLPISQAEKPLDQWHGLVDFVLNEFDKELFPQFEVFEGYQNELVRYEDLPGWWSDNMYGAITLPTVPKTPIDDYKLPQLTEFYREDFNLYWGIPQR